jgi:integrase
MGQKLAAIAKRNGRWRARIIRKGYPPVTKTFDTHKAATDWASVIEATMANGAFVSRKEAETTTLGELLKRYRDEVAPRHKGAAQDTCKLNNFIKAELACRIVGTLTSQDFARWRDMRLAQVSPATVNREMNLWHAVLEQSRREWGIHLHCNPVSLVRRPEGADVKRDRRFEGDEEARLLRACATDTNAFLAPIVRFAVASAMRQSEMCGLRWAHVRGRVAHLADTKNGEARDVPLSSGALTILAGLPRSLDGRVFPITQNVLKMRFRRACKRAGIAGLTFHDLRHEAISRLFEHDTERFTLIEVAAVSGHKTLNMLKRYANLSADKLAARLG